MANCQNCGGPLPHNSGVCPFCDGRNDVDLHAFQVASQGENHTRICPQCDIPLETFGIQRSTNPESPMVEIERCHQCMGLFFDPNELEYLLQNAVHHVFTIDRERMAQINRELRPIGKKNVYRRCPICREFMPFKNYGSKSGVIVDHCKNHGIWLDGGELKHLLEWTKAGGKFLPSNPSLAPAPQAPPQHSPQPSHPIAHRNRSPSVDPIASILSALSNLFH